MIIDKIGNKEKYRHLGDGIQKALNWLETLQPDVNPGNYVLLGEQMYANIIETDTSADVAGLYEAHQKYIDIHYLICGEEMIDYADIDELDIAVPYDTKIDSSFLYSIDVPKSVRLLTGDFCIFYPDDGHRPCRCISGQSSSVKKAIVKVQADTSNRDS